MLALAGELAAFVLLVGHVHRVAVALNTRSRADLLRHPRSWGHWPLGCRRSGGEHGTTESQGVRAAHANGARA